MGPFFETQCIYNIIAYIASIKPPALYTCRNSMNARSRSLKVKTGKEESLTTDERVGNVCDVCTEWYWSAGTCWRHQWLVDEHGGRSRVAAGPIYVIAVSHKTRRSARLTQSTTTHSIHATRAEDRPSYMRVYNIALRLDGFRSSIYSQRITRAEN